MRIKHWLPFVAAAFMAVTIPVFAMSTGAYHHELDEAHASVKRGDYKGAYDRVSKLAHKGHSCAQCLLGVMYQKGIGVGKDANQAMKWFQLSAKKGFPDAENRLGHNYLNGYMVDKDMKAAQKWLGRAAKHGVAEAQLTLGKLYLAEKDAPEKALEGRRLIRLAADQGLDEAKQMLDQMPGYQAWQANANSGALQTVNGVHNVQESWAGYGQLVQSMDSLVSQASR